MDPSPKEPLQASRRYLIIESKAHLVPIVVPDEPPKSDFHELSIGSVPTEAKERLGWLDHSTSMLGLRYYWPAAAGAPSIFHPTHSICPSLSHTHTHTHTHLSDMLQAAPPNS